MDFLNKGLSQLGDLFKSMSPGSRLTAGLLLIVTVVSLAYLFNQQIATSDAYLMGGEPFPAAQIPAMEAAFDKAGLHNYELDGNRIRVPRGQQAAYMGALADAGALPPDFGKFFEKAIASGGPFTSRAQQEQLNKLAVQNELQLIIRSMKGIERAAVLYDVQKKRNFGEESVVTASVSVKPMGNQLLEEDRVGALRHVVASAIAGLKPENVTVIDLNGRHYPPESGPNGGGAIGGNDWYSTRKKMYEKHWENQIASALRFVPGAQVTANVELDTETGHEKSITAYDPKAVVFRQQEQATTKTLDTMTPAGRPGLEAQGGANSSARVGSTPSTKSNEENTHTETASAIPTTQERITQHGLTPKRVTVSVGVPSSYYKQIWNERNPAVDGQPPKKPTDAELSEIESRVKADLEKTVVALLPSPGVTNDPYPRVTVTTFQHLATADLPAPSMADKGLAWFGQYWQTLGVAALAIVALLMLRSTLRATATAEPAAPVLAAPGGVELALSTVESDVDQSAAEEGEPGKPKSRLKRRGPGGPSLRDELSEIVKEDPEAAVSILRNWIGNAA